MYIDSHCHLTHKRLLNLGGPEQLVANAKNAEVDGMLTISCQITGDFPDALKLAQQFDNVWCTVGTHPHDAHQQQEKDISQEQLIDIAKSDSQIIGIGETGLDYFYKYSPIDDQQDSLRKHIRASIETDLPLVIHARDADDDIIRILKEEGSNIKPKGVMHCFSSSPDMGDQALDLGFYISFSGIVTFNKSQELQDFAKTVPLDRILIETDAPFLAPEPFRGKTNEPAYVIHTAKFLSKLKSISEESIARHSKQNFFSLFDRAVLPT